MDSSKVRVHANPAPLSASSLGSSSLQGFDTFDTSTITRRSGSARDAIFSLSGVGTNLRAGKMLSRELSSQLHERTPKEQEQGPPSIGFLKPMGVDEPITRNSDKKTFTKSKMLKPPVPNVIDGARKKKRDRNPKEQTDEETTKKRRIKRSVLSRPPDEE